jgi:hypothetical protein
MFFLHRSTFGLRHKVIDMGCKPKGKRIGNNLCNVVDNTRPKIGDVLYVIILKLGIN